MEAASRLNSLQPIVFGKNALELWPLTNVAMLGWLPMAFLPKWKYTPTLAKAAALFQSGLYASCLIASIASGNSGDIDFTSLSGIVKMFSNPDVVFIGWVHYLAFDLMMGRMMLQDFMEREGWSYLKHALIMVPCLWTTLMFGPTGLVLYTILQGTVLGKKQNNVKKD